MTDEPARDSWNKALSLYDGLAAAGWAHIPRFRSLVAVLACSQRRAV